MGERRLSKLEEILEGLTHNLQRAAEISLSRSADVRERRGRLGELRLYARLSAIAASNVGKSLSEEYSRIGRERSSFVGRHSLSSYKRRDRSPEILRLEVLVDALYAIFVDLLALEGRIQGSLPAWEGVRYARTTEEPSQAVYVRSFMTDAKKLERWGWRLAVKRAIDIVLATVSLLLTAPLFLCVAILVRLSSPGPILFRQVRCGKYGEPFSMYKFRTMRLTDYFVNQSDRLLDPTEGFYFKLDADPRITSIGRFLRKTSLDELPQFFNVLRGDMSLVGPRPPLVEEAQSYDEILLRRMLVKPGVTGLWQVSGPRLSWEDGVRLDLNYVENWSLWHDFGDRRQDNG
jgi:lipopolysaccharide/colanic/teichoic acid biosynthesis glycosyltransferase